MSEIASLMERPSGNELSHERVLAERFAGLKLFLAAVNFLVISLDRPDPATTTHISLAYGAAAIFFLYMLFCFQAIRKRWIQLRAYQTVYPFVDILFSVGLILATDGYLSPFHLWMTLTVVAAGFGSEIRIPLMVGVMAVAAQLVIARVPQVRPLDYSVFVVRTVYLLGFASIIAAASSQLVLQSRTLEAIARLGEDLYSIPETDEAIRYFENALLTQLRAGSVTVATHADPELIASGYLIHVGSDQVLSCQITRASALTNSEDQFIRLAADRLSTTLKRISLSRQLVESATREERQRYADELHDTYLQTLAAVDMRVKVAEKTKTTEGVHRELKEIREMVRDSAARTRAFIRTVEEQPPSGPDSIKQVVGERWPGTPVEIDSKLDLTEGQWRVVQMMIQEGINNARRHGGARRGSVSLIHTSHGVEGALVANGKTPKADFRYGYGLKRLDAVARANKGEIALIGLPEGGSKLSVLFRTEEEA